jgi:uncharacterized protein
MSERTLREFVYQYPAAQPRGCSSIEFAWQGGEPLLIGRNFYTQAIDMQQRYMSSWFITNTIQTNGSLLDQRWCDLFIAHKFLVGLSYDGPKHDTHRQFANGNGSSAQYALQALRMLQESGIDYNVLTTVNSGNVQDPLETYHHLVHLGVRHIQFIPIVDDWDGLSSYSVTAKAYGNFL